MRDKKIGVLCGGISNEREVSLRSGANVHRILEEGGYNSVLIDLVTPKDLASLLKQHHIDCVFNTLHGLYGEDGALQGDLNYLGVPYTGCGYLSSGIGMNKLFTKLIAKSLGFNVPRYCVLEAHSERENWEILAKELPFPWFIKPLCGGSSRETYLVKGLQDISKLELDSCKSYLLEELIQGTEITEGVLTSGEKEVILPILSLLPTNEFYDYEAKYTEGKTKFVCPAPLPLELSKKIGEESLKMHKILGCNGATRCDFIIQKDTNIPYFLEINTSPGMTKLSDIPAQAKAYGFSEVELCEWILQTINDPKG